MVLLGIIVVEHLSIDHIKPKSGPIIIQRKHCHTFQTDGDGDVVNAVSTDIGIDFRAAFRIRHP